MHAAMQCQNTIDIYFASLILGFFFLATSFVALNITISIRMIDAFIIIIWADRCAMLSFHFVSLIKSYTNGFCSLK